VIFVTLTVVRVTVTVVLKKVLVGWRSNEGRLKSSWTGGSAPLLCRGMHNSIKTAHCHQSTNISKGPRTYTTEHRSLNSFISMKLSNKNFIYISCFTVYVRYLTSYLITLNCSLCDFHCVICSIHCIYQDVTFRYSP